MFLITVLVYGGLLTIMVSGFAAADVCMARAGDEESAVIVRARFLMNLARMMVRPSRGRHRKTTSVRKVDVWARVVHAVDYPLPIWY
jgi:hypothetical protein